MKIQSIRLLNSIKPYKVSKASYLTKNHSGFDTVSFKAGIKNPVTKEHDEELKKLESRFDKYLNYFFLNKSDYQKLFKDDIKKMLTVSCIDNVTGKIDKRVVDFFVYYLFKAKNNFLAQAEINTLAGIIGFTSNFMKDSNGHFNQKNIDFMTKIAKSAHGFKDRFDMEFLWPACDKDQTVKDSCEKFILDHLEELTSYSIPNKFGPMFQYARFEQKDAQAIFELCQDAFPNNFSKAYEAFECAAAFTLDYDYKFCQKDFEFEKNIAELNPEWLFDIGHLNEFRDNDGKLPRHLKNKACEFARDCESSVSEFAEIYKSCISDDISDNRFNENLFQKYKKLTQIKINPFILYDDISICLKKPSKYKYSSVYRLYSDLPRVIDAIGNEFVIHNKKINLTEVQKELYDYLTGQYRSEDINDEQKQKFIDNVLHSKEFDEVLSSSIDILKNSSLDDIDKESKLYRAINSIIEGIPEFSDIIGRIQHGVHEYTLDIHTLLVLAHAINNPKYQKLSDNDKQVLKLACILHDIAKPEGENDPTHGHQSAFMSGAVVDRYTDDEETKRRILNLIRNHEWLKEYVLAADKVRQTQIIAFRYRRPGEFELAKILTESDIKSISSNPPSEFLNNFNDIAPIEETINFINTTGSAIFSNYPTKGFRIIDFRCIHRSKAMSDYGFNTNATKDKLCFLVHMIDENNIKQNLDKVKLLTTDSNEKIFSASLISDDITSTFCNRKFGFILDVANYDILLASSKNLASGYEKSEKNILNFLYSNLRTKNMYNFLHEGHIKLTKEQYAQLYINVLSKCNSIDEIIDDKEYIVGDITLSGRQIKQLISFNQKQLLTDAYQYNNEIVVCAPKIKGMIAIRTLSEDLPKQFVKFAKENDIPVVLI